MAYYKIILTIKTVVSRQLYSIIYQIPHKSYLPFLKMALKIRMKAMPPIHITSRISGVI